MVLKTGMSRLALAAALTAGGCAQTPDADIAGVWRGTWTKAGDTVDVTVDIEPTPAGYAASFDADELQLSSVPFSSVEVDGLDVAMLLEGESSISFEGQVTGAQIAGALAEGSLAGQFTLTRDTAALPPLAMRDVSFDGDGARLAGTLILPPDAEAPAPGVLFIPGASDEGLWEQRYLAEQLARHGFVVLVYDKRGVGESTGDWRDASFAALAGDAAAGARLLRSAPEVDAARIGVYGHDHGATVAAILAPSVEPSFIIAGAATGETYAETEAFSMRNYLGVSRLPPEEQADAEAYVQEIVAVAFEGAPRDRLDAMIVDFADRPWFTAPPAADDPAWRRFRLRGSYAPKETWSHVAAPVLLLWGEHDERVDMPGSVLVLLNALASGGNMDARVRILERADHDFRIVDPPPGDGWRRPHPDFVTTVVSWAEEMTSRDAGAPRGPQDSRTQLLWKEQGLLPPGT